MDRNSEIEALDKVLKIIDECIDSATRARQGAANDASYGYACDTYWERWDARVDALKDLKIQVLELKKESLTS